MADDIDESTRSDLTEALTAAVAPAGAPVADELMGVVYDELEGAARKVGAGHRIGRGPADDEAVALAYELEAFALELDRAAVEGAQHGRRRRRLHGQIVV